MKKLNKLWAVYKRPIAVIGLFLSLLGIIFLTRLTSLNHSNFSFIELKTAHADYGWHGIFNDPNYLLLKILRSIAYTFDSSHSLLATRLPNVIIGILTVVIFAWLIKIWHGTRTALLSTALFATSAWVLHASRLGNNDVLYLMLVPALLLTVAALQRHATKPIVFYGSMLLWGAFLYLPGAVWLIGLTIFWERKALKQAWLHFNTLKNRALYVFSTLIWLPLLIINLGRFGEAKQWLGIPHNLPSTLELIHKLWEVLFNLMIHGPSNPSIWLYKAPMFDVFTLLMAVFGIYFYIKHWRVGRARILLSYFVVGAILIALGGPVSLSLIVPLIYISVATGVAYIIHEWLQVFPINPFARIIGISLVVIAISLSSIYNLRAYYIAWPNNTQTIDTFHYKQ